jgi:biotin carboxyl carrier protein
MKNFRVTVNGNIYDVGVEELSAAMVSTPVVAPVAPQAVPAPLAPTPVPTVVSTPPTPSATAPATAKKINSPMPGTILDIKVQQGDLISENQVVVILEAMKMENEIVSPFVGKVASINVSKGASVNSGDLLLSVE